MDGYLEKKVSIHIRFIQHYILCNYRLWGFEPKFLLLTYFL